jgi:hypothetical protein
MPPDAASIARYAKQRRQHGGREGCPKADADAALKARPARGCATDPPMWLLRSVDGHRR